MGRKPDILYLVNEKGRKIAVQMSYRAFRKLIEGIEDLRVCLERRDEPRRDFEEVVAELRAAGRL